MLLQSSSSSLQSSVLVSRKSSSTPSLSESVEPKLMVASSDQVASAENLTSDSTLVSIWAACVLLNVFAVFYSNIQALVF